MSSKTEISDTDRLRVYVALKYRDGCVSGDSLGDVARKLRVRDMSIAQVKRILGSLAYSKRRKRQVIIMRPCENGERRYVLAVHHPQ